MFNDVIGRLPTIPEYYRLHINKNIDLEVEPHQLCPFHEDKDTPSFSFSREKNVWRCFGGCKCGGDVIDLHRKNYKVKTRKEAEKSLKAMYQVYEETPTQVDTGPIQTDAERIEFESVYQTACIKANCVERWLELDYVMSMYPVETASLKDLLEKWEQQVT